MPSSECCWRWRAAVAGVSSTCLGPPLWALLGPSGAVLRLSGSAVGGPRASWRPAGAVLGLSGGARGAQWGRLGALLGRLWAACGRPGGSDDGVLGQIEAFSELPGAVSSPLWPGMGRT